MKNEIKATDQLFDLFEMVSGCSVSDFSKEDLSFLSDFIQGQMEADDNCIELLKSRVKSRDDQIKKLRDALGHFVDGNSEFDLLGMTGLSIEECREIMKLWRGES